LNACAELRPHRVQLQFDEDMWVSCDLPETRILKTFCLSKDSHVEGLGRAWGGFGF
jgi:hypothetical protein